MDSAKQKFNEAYDQTKNSQKADRGAGQGIPGTARTNFHPAKESGDPTPNSTSGQTSSTDKDKHGGGGGLLSSIFSTGSGGDAAR